MDLEMTGLEPRRDVIVEIATLITDDHLNIIAEGPDLVLHASPEQLAEMGPSSPRCTRSRDCCPRSSRPPPPSKRRRARTLDFLKQHIPDPGSVPLCGNSIGTDRRFLQEYMPELEAYFHYRNVDVSTIKELARRWNPAVLDAMPEKETTHRALDDIRESIAELVHYRTTLFQPIESNQ